MAFQLLGTGSSRSVRTKKNILAMLLLKGGNILIGFLLVPLTIDYVDSDTYGIWIAISSIVAWFSFFDIGLGNGLKNRLTESLAEGDFYRAKKYVSTTYALLTVIFVPLMVVLLLIAPHMDWTSILNVSNVDKNVLLTSMSIVISYFCINFIFSTINIILQADQRAADESLRVLIQQALSLGVVYVMTLLTEGNLTLLCMALCAAPLVVVVIFNVTLFSGRYRKISPSFKDIDFKLTPDLLKLGVLFFIIQVAGIVQYQMTNFLIIRYFGASDVTSYNVAYKLFNSVMMVWNIFLIPLWPAVTDAITKKDIGWVRNAVRNYLKVFILFLIGSLLLLAICGPVYDIWIGDKVSVPFAVSLWVMVFNLAMMFGGVFVSVLNGAGVLKVQAIASLISPALFLGCFFHLKNLGLGVEAILISSVIANFNGLILAPVQYIHRFVLRNDAVRE